MDYKEQELKSIMFDSKKCPADVFRLVTAFCRTVDKMAIADVCFSQWMYIEPDDSMSVRWGATVYYMVDTSADDVML
jgi:hypothetical protein